MGQQAQAPDNNVFMRHAADILRYDQENHTVMPMALGCLAPNLLWPCGCFFFLMQKLVEEIVPLGPCLMLSMKPFSPLLVMFHGYCLYCTIRNIPIHHYQKRHVNHRLGGGFKIFFIFTPFWGRFPIWLFRWVVQPPTSSNMLLSRCLAGFLQFTNSILRWNWLDWCQDPQDGDGMISPCSSLATLPLEEAHDSPKAEKYVDRIRICTPPKTDMDTNNSHSWQENHLPNFF